MREVREWRQGSEARQGSEGSEGVSERYLTGKHAVVTGGGKGIGAAIAAELARLGADVSLLGRDRDALAAHAERPRAEHGVRAAAIHCDVSSEPSVSGALGEAQRVHGVPYVLVNNAGQAEAAPLANTSRELWERTLAVNLTGAFLCCRIVLPALLEARSGRIVNIASTAGLKAYPGVAAYVASKHGLIGLTRALALETARHGITVNAVCPGYTDTEMAAVAVRNVMARTGKRADEARQVVVRTMPRGEWVRPSEVANAVAWLCGPDAGAVTGQSIVVAGGEVM